MPAGIYDNPLADFLNAIPGYVNQYQQNQLQLQRQELADKRYDDAQLIAKNQRRLEQERYNKTIERQQDRDNRADYERILSRLGKYDYANMKKVADQYVSDFDAD